MPYENLGGVKAAFVDGSLREPRTTDQPRILVVAPAESGLTNELYIVTNTGSAEREFGAATAVMRGVHECLAQGADNVSIMRSGGRPGSVVLTDTSAHTLTITPSSNDNEILDRYALIVENDGSENRVLVYDLEDEEFVFDSSEIEVLNEGAIEVDGLDDITDLWQLNDRSDPTAGIALSDMVVGDFDTSGSNVAPASSVATDGDDGSSPSLPARYAALSTTYFGLDYEDADFIYPVDTYIDDANIADDASPATYGYYWAGVPQAGGAQDKLGYLWQYVFRGRVYTYFADTSTYFSVSKVAATKTVATDLVLTSLVAGKGGNANTLQVALGGAPAATVTENSNGGMDILLTAVTGVTTTTVAATTINTALAAFTHSTGVLGNTLVSAAGAATVIAAIVAKGNFTTGAGGHVLTHTQLTGETIPSAVSTKFAAGVDAELREVNFAHQLASACELASKNWHAVQGAISFKAPDGYGRSQIADWVGSLPTYSDNGQEQYIDAPADNGEGVLGQKLLAGKSAAAGYRAGMVTDGGANDSLAYGGIIKTEGASLPNGTQWPYGISSSDEALDSNEAPVDLGKFVYVCGDWVIHTNAYNGGSTYRGPIPGTFLGKSVTLAENIEPIGQNGRTRRVQLGRRIHSTQLDGMAQIRVITLRREEGGLNLTFASAKTAAHPDSDYTRMSTMRCVNKHLEDIRGIARPYIGKAFNSKSLISLQAAVDQYLQQARVNGFNEGAISSLSYTRSSKILGQLTIKLKMVPPFTIDTITVETTMAADESEL
jgi:hypothetical protein